MEDLHDSLLNMEGFEDFEGFDSYVFSAQWQHPMSGEWLETDFRYVQANIADSELPQVLGDMDIYMQKTPTLKQCIALLPH